MRSALVEQARQTTEAVSRIQTAFRDQDRAIGNQTARLQASVADNLEDTVRRVADTEKRHYDEHTEKIAQLYKVCLMVVKFTFNINNVKTPELWGIMTHKFHSFKSTEAKCHSNPYNP